MIDNSYKADCTGILNDNGKVLNNEQYKAVIVEIIKNMCAHISQMHLADTTPAQLSDLSSPEIIADKEILIKVRIFITSYRILAIMMRKNNKNVLEVKSFGTV